MNRRHAVWIAAGLLLTLSGGCQSMKKFLNREPDPAKLQEQAEAKEKQPKTPREALPFQGKRAPAPSLYDSTLSERERAELKKFRHEADHDIAEPGESKESKTSRNWVFGY